MFLARNGRKDLQVAYKARFADLDKRRDERARRAGDQSRHDDQLVADGEQVADLERAAGRELGYPAIVAIDGVRANAGEVELHNGSLAGAGAFVETAAKGMSLVPNVCQTPRRAPIATRLSMRLDRPGSRTALRFAAYVVRRRRTLSAPARPVTPEVAGSSPVAPVYDAALSFVARAEEGDPERPPSLALTDAAAWVRLVDAQVRRNGRIGHEGRRQMGRCCS
jgi:hypothetical protein